MVPSHGGRLAHCFVFLSSLLQAALTYQQTTLQEECLAFVEQNTEVLHMTRGLTILAINLHFYSLWYTKIASPSPSLSVSVYCQVINNWRKLGLKLQGSNSLSLRRCSRAGGSMKCQRRPWPLCSSQIS